MKAAVDAGSKAAGKVGELISSHIIARPHEDLLKAFLGEAGQAGRQVDAPRSETESTSNHRLLWHNKQLE